MAERNTRGWGWRVLLAAVLVSLLVGGVAGGLVGGSAAYVLLTLRKAAPAQTSAPVEPPSWTPAPGTTIVVTGTQPIAAVVSRVGPTVVTVVNRLEKQPIPFWGIPTEPQQATGSGVIVDPRGYIVTNYHVVEGAAELSVILADGATHSAELVAHDYPFTDLAVLKIEGSGYPYATLGNSDLVQPGEQVVAIGSALGDFRNTVTVGVVSGLGRSLQISQDQVLEGMIQTDAAINHGNSGGPLVNMRGEVIGINTAIVRGSGLSGDVAEGLGFAIPSNTVAYVVRQILEKGKVARPYLGIRSVSISRNMAVYYDLPVDHGVYVTEVVRGGPADKAGIRRNDILVRIGEYTIDEAHPLINVLSHFESGQEVEVEVRRDSQTLELKVVLGVRP